MAKILLSLSEVTTALLFERKRDHKRKGEKKKKRIQQAKPAAAGERKHRNTNVEAGHRVQTNTKKDCKVNDKPNGESQS